MITKVWGKNFGPFKDFSVELGPITFFAGPNASGKSTLLRAIRCIALLAKTPLYGKSGKFRLGFKAELEDLFPPNREQQMTLGITTDSDLGSGRYEATIGYVRDRLNFINESADWTSRDGSSFHFASDSEPLKFGYMGRFEVTSELPRTASLMYVAYPYRSDPKWSKRLAPLWELVSSFTPFYVYRFSPSELSAPVPLNTDVRHDGRGLVSVLEVIATNEADKFSRLVESLRQTFDHIKTITFPNLSDPRGGPALKTLAFERQDGIRVPAELESDGVLLTLAHLWLSTLTHPAIGVEEPETATYPSLAASRVKLLRDMSEGKLGHPSVQVLATTHSAALLLELNDPTLVRVLDLHPDGTCTIESPVALNMTDIIRYYLRKLV